MGVGAIAAQALVNPYYRVDGLTGGFEAAGMMIRDCVIRCDGNSRSLCVGHVIHRYLRNIGIDPGGHPLFLLQ